MKDRIALILFLLVLLGAIAVAQIETKQTIASMGGQPASANLTNWSNYSTNMVGNTASNTAASMLVWTNDAGRSRLANTATTRIGFASTNTFIYVDNNRESVAIGTSVGDGGMAGANENVFMGWQAAFSMTGGDANVGIGYKTFRAATDAANNVGIGNLSFLALTTGSENTGVGKDSLAAITTSVNNSALGWDCLDVLIKGDNNTGVGAEVLHFMTYGYENTGIGYRAGYLSQTNYNTFLGAFADDRDFPGVKTNSVAIGWGSKYHLHNMVRLGNEITEHVITSGRVTATNGLVTGAGSSRSNAVVGGLYFQGTTSFTNLNATPATLTNLATATIAANVLTNLGDTVMAIWGGKLANAAANTNNFQIVYGSETILDTGLQISSNTTFRAEVIITRTGDTAQHAEGYLSWGPGGGVPFVWTNTNLEITQTNGIPTLLALRGASQRVGAHTNNSFRVYYEPGVR